MEKKVCLITGASGDIGKEVTRRFLREAYETVMIAFDHEKLEKTIREENFDRDRILPLAVDVSDEDAVRKAIDRVEERYGRIDALVNTAGICGEYSLTADYPYEDFKKIYEVNVFGVFLMMKYSIPVMLKASKGSIVNIASVSGMRGYSYESAYGSSKWALIGLTQNVANEYGGKGIRCNCVSPGWVRSSMMDKTLDCYRKLGMKDPESCLSYGSIKRGADPCEIANAVYFLSSDQASYINGVNLAVDGGMTIQ